MKNSSMPTKVFTILGIASLAFLLGCGATGVSSANGLPSAGPPAPLSIVVKVSPDSATLQAGFSQQFTATVQNDPTNKGVTWSVVPPAGANCSGTDCGTIDSTGRYTSPSTAHESPGLDVVATSVADPKSTGTAVAFITPTPSAIAVTPSVVTVQNDGVRKFFATGSPIGAIPVVHWSVSGSGCSGASCGTIDSTGNYTAPVAPPNPPDVTITATSVTDSSDFGSATARLGSNQDNAKLNGRYAFLLEGYDGAGNVAMAGSFVADGKGNITDGRADFNFSSFGFVDLNVTLSGNYSVNSDNRASMTIEGPITDFTPTFSFALGSFDGGVASRGRIIQLDYYQFWTTGFLAKQDPAAFSTAAISGGYAFGFAGTAASGWPMTAIGRFSTNGGTLSAGQADVYGLGLAQDGSGTVTAALDQPFGGIYEVSANGRGTAVLNFTGQDPGFSKLSFYVISAGELVFIEVDTCASGPPCRFKGGISGEALRQTAGPFSASSLHGPVVFSLTATDTATKGSVAVGLETFDGINAVAGLKDENDFGVVASNVLFNGTYALDTNGLGRGEISLAGDLHSKPFYLISPGKGFTIDSGSYESGMFEPQSGAPFGVATLSGNYVLGTLPWNYNWTFSPDSGVVAAKGDGTLTGVTDGRGGSGTAVDASYSINPNGRTTMTSNPTVGSPSNWTFYLVSPSKALGILEDAGVTNRAIRIIEK